MCVCVCLLGFVLPRTVAEVGAVSSGAASSGTASSGAASSGTGRETGRGVDADAQYSENGGDGGAGEAVHVPLLESDVDRQVADAGSAQFRSGIQQFQQSGGR